MKRFSGLLLIIIAVLCIVGCEDSTGAQSEISSEPNFGDAVSQDVGTDAALYVAMAEYGETDPDTGCKLNYTFESQETVGGRSYYVFSVTLTDENGEKAGNKPDIYVAQDGSHTTTLEALELQYSDSYSEEPTLEADDFAVYGEDDAALNERDNYESQSAVNSEILPENDIE